MTDYTKSTNFATKDNLSSGNPLKIVKGTEIDTEFNNIATAIATKADLASPTFTGTVLVSALTASSTITGNLTGNVTGNVTGNTSGTSGSVATTNWTISESGGKIYFSYSGTKKAMLDSSGNLTVVGNVTAYGTVT
jgi:phage gp45-like